MPETRRFPIGTTIRYQWWTVPRPDAWRRGTIVGHERTSDGTYMHRVVETGYVAAMNLDAITNCEAITQAKATEVTE